MKAAIDLHNSGLHGTVDGKNNTGPAAPGFACSLPEGLVLGEAAFEQWRSRPQAVANRFWHDEPESLSGLTQEGEFLPHGVLAYCHLQQTLEQTEASGKLEALALSVPVEWPETLQSLVVECVRDWGGPLNLLVARPLALVAGLPGPAFPKGPLRILDLHYHGAVVNGLEWIDGRVRVLPLESRGTLSRLGLLTIWDRLLRESGRLLLRSTGYDLKEDAEKEQIFFNSLHRQLSTLETGTEMRPGIEVRGAQFFVTIPYAEIAEWIREDCLALAALLESAPPQATLVLSATASRLPGLRETILQTCPWAVERPDSLRFASPETAALGTWQLLQRVKESPKDPLRLLPLTEVALEGRFRQK